MIPFYAAIDWGTSRFRLWVLGEDGKILHEISTDEGLLNIGALGFEAILEKHLNALGCPADLSVVVCGMAGSRTGWQEAAYLDTPVDLAKIINNSVRVPHLTRDIRILPGLAQRDASMPDVMRGEETQLLGMLHRQIGQNNNGEQIICMPGTHSKWVHIEDQTVKGFTTFMSGELFSLISEHSILKNSITKREQIISEDPVFTSAVMAAIAKPEAITAQLFSIRSSQLLGFSDPSTAKAALSGMIIGLELAGAKAKFGQLQTVTLLASGNLGLLYKSALKCVDIETELDDAESAGRVGLYHAAFLLWGQHKKTEMRKARQCQG
ncbi:MAG: 2-dehydro-3-deoxygalactonokinase [Salaquimonas sp.]